MTKLHPGAHMLHEIREQPEALSRLLSAEADRVWKTAERWRKTPPSVVLIAARGTSDHVAMYGKYLFEIANGIPVSLAAPSTATAYKARLRMKGGLCIGISQSGEAADVIETLRQAKRGGAETVAITNEPDSPLCSIADYTMLLHAHRERSVAATKTYTSSLAAMALLSAAIGGSRKMLADLRHVPQAMNTVLAREDETRQHVERFRFLEECVVLGRGLNLGTAHELSLKLRETCYVRAQPFASPDFVHGPIAVLMKGYPVFAIANHGPILPTLMDGLRAVKARGAELVVIGNASAALKLADVPFSTHPGHRIPEALSPFGAIVIGQMIACELSLLKGLNPDAPRGLHKVTVTT